VVLRPRPPTANLAAKLRSHREYMPPPLRVHDGALGALKLLALVLMTADHINKYLFNGTSDLAFNAGRAALPIFCFVLAVNLAREGSMEKGAYQRTSMRLALFGMLATPIFLLLGGLLFKVYPLNVMFTLLAITHVTYELDKGRTGVALALGLAAGALVEYWWPALLFGAAVWSYSRKPTYLAALVALANCAALHTVNGNYWALAAFPVIGSVISMRWPVPRARWLFYAYYPTHLLLILLARIPMAEAGYLFFL
jgi:hypothetical protein